MLTAVILASVMAGACSNRATKATPIPPITATSGSDSTTTAAVPTTATSSKFAKFYLQILGPADVASGDDPNGRFGYGVPGTTARHHHGRHAPFWLEAPSV